MMGKLVVVGCDGWIQWWVGYLVSLSMGYDGDGQIDGGGLRWMDSVVGWLLGQPIDGL